MDLQYVALLLSDILLAAANNRPGFWLAVTRTGDELQECEDEQCKDKLSWEGDDDPTLDIGLFSGMLMLEGEACVAYLPRTDQVVARARSCGASMAAVCQCQC